MMLVIGGAPTLHSICESSSGLNRAERGRCGIACSLALADSQLAVAAAAGKANLARWLFVNG